MGYSEVLCQICGVSFNISRFRTDKEPRSAAWSNTGDGVGDFVVWDENDRDNCGENCYYLQQRLVSNEPEVLMPADEEDSDYEPSIHSVDSCPYEYDSNYESDAGSSSGLDSDEAEDHETASDSVLESLYRQFLRPFEVNPKPQTECVELPKILPSCETLPKWNDDGERWGLEHVAGKGCQHEGAYMGHKISAEAMKGCNTVQCFARKTQKWSEEPDDEEFERTGRFFLTGLCDSMPSRDVDIPKFVPQRHGISDGIADNFTDYFDVEDPTLATVCMPFHPTCLEIYKRASLFRDGVVDLDGLENWWFLDTTYDSYWSIPRDNAVKLAGAQWWRHNSGHEFLAANPCLVPGLDSLFSQSQGKVSVNAAQHCPEPDVDSSADVFFRLPLEIKLMILTSLAFKDIINLRAASFAFKTLPESFFHQRIIKRRPWLYEAWSTLPLSYWSTKTAAEVKEEQTFLEAQLAIPRAALDVLEDEARESAEPNLHEELLEALKSKMAKMVDEARARPVPLFPENETQWYNLTLQIDRKWSQLKGLANRKRIWKDCMHILEKVAAARKQGRIPDNGSMSLPSRSLKIP